MKTNEYSVENPILNPMAIIVHILAKEEPIEDDLFSDLLSKLDTID